MNIGFYRTGLGTDIKQGWQRQDGHRKPIRGGDTSTASNISEGEADVGFSNIWEKSIQGKRISKPKWLKAMAQQ